MASETKNNQKFTENVELPVLETPHFDDEEIAQAQPVQPLARFSQRRTMPRTISLVATVAMIVAGLVGTSALAIGFVKSSSLLRSTTNDDAMSSEIETKEQSVFDGSTDVGEKSQTRAYQGRKSSNRRFERPRLIIRMGVGDDRKPKARLVSVIQ